MSVLMSWARSTLANVEHTLGRSDHMFDRMLIGVLVLLAIASWCCSPPPERPVTTRSASPATGRDHVLNDATLAVRRSQ